jgi:hypothetical protein
LRTVPRLVTKQSSLLSCFTLIIVFRIVIKKLINLRVLQKDLEEFSMVVQNPHK